MNSPADAETGRRADRQTDRQAGQAGRQAGREGEEQTTCLISGGSGPLAAKWGQGTCTQFLSPEPPDATDAWTKEAEIGLFSGNWCRWHPSFPAAHFTCWRSHRTHGPKHLPCHAVPCRMGILSGALSKPCPTRTPGVPLALGRTLRAPGGSQGPTWDHRLGPKPHRALDHPRGIGPLHPGLSPSPGPPTNAPQCSGAAAGNSGKPSGRGSGTQKFVYQKCSKSILLYFIFSLGPGGGVQGGVSAPRAHRARTASAPRQVFEQLPSEMVYWERSCK